MNIKQNIFFRKTALFIIVVVSVVAGVLLAFKLAFFLMPFLIAFALSSLMEPVIRFLTKKVHFKRSGAAPLVLLLILGSIVTLVVLAILKLIKEFKDLLVIAPDLLSNLYTKIMDLVQQGSEYTKWMPVELTDNLRNAFTNLSTTITGFSATVVKGAFVTATSLPEILIFTLITILATFFLSKDRDRIAAVFARHLPESWLHRILAVKKDLFNALFGYLRAALIMMSITFAEVFIGLSIIGIDYTLLLAFLTALIDALPVLGTGSVLIPWSVYSFVTGDIRMGISLLVLYFVVLVVRQIIEPKVVGHQIGVYPLMTLLAMYTGLRLIGFAGLILGPISYLIIRNILLTIYKGRSVKEIIGLNGKGADNTAKSADNTAISTDNIAENSESKSTKPD
ncbi:MAG TPA: sporulation integral membrane protein YtvI [Clostridia bacterium]|nr:sporulation integral membrane protein YtvI [Clostridia bacterium]